MTMIRLIGKLLGDERGGTAIEYGLIVAVVVIAMLASLITFAHTAIDIWGNVAGNVASASH